jgi:hypothetical protein
MKLRFPHFLLGIPLIGLGLFLIIDGSQRSRPAPPPSTYLGPFRLLALPFLWTEWGEARRAGRLREATEYGKWITFILPGQWDLFLGFAWEIAYDLPSQNPDPHFQAESLIEALLLLEEGMRVHPSVKRLPILAAFMLQDRILWKKDPALEKAFQEIVGQSPKKAYLSYVDRVLTLCHKKKLPNLRKEVAGAFLAEAKFWLLKKRTQKAEPLLLRAARILEPTEETRAKLYKAVAKALKTKGSIPKPLLSRLAKDPAFAKQ